MRQTPAQKMRARPRPFEWIGRLRAQRLRKQAQHALLQGRSRLALGHLRRAMRCCSRTVALSSMQAAEILRADAATAEDLRTAVKLYRRVLSRVSAQSPMRERATEKLTLMACQQRRNAAATKLLFGAGYQYRLSSQILAYSIPRAVSERPRLGLTGAAHAAAPAPTGVAHVVDGALPVTMLHTLQLALGPESVFWTEHRYRCSITAIPVLFTLTK